MAARTGAASEAAMTARSVHLAAGRGLKPPPARVDEAVIDRALRSAAAVPGSPLAGPEIDEPAGCSTECRSN
ncbi:hypothetical protein ILP97_18845 [Amycolatopsis sp. H6(2020)]|nr:hypothetical protein [Amycolatopsis sp. H6(2020)]